MQKKNNKTAPASPQIVMHMARGNGGGGEGGGDVTQAQLSQAITTHNFAPTSHQSQFDAKQNILVSGESIKTVNGESVLGAGDIITPTLGGDNQFTGDNDFIGDNDFSGNNTFGGNNTFTGNAEFTGNLTENGLPVATEAFVNTAFSNNFVQAADESEALLLSAQNPTKLYWW